MSNQAPDPDLLIQARGICLELAGRQVLDSVDISVRSGEIVTLIGPNGSGKTTFVRLLLGILHADSGELYTRHGLRVGYMPQRLQVDEVLPLSVERFIQMAGDVNADHLSAVVEQVGITRLLNSPVQSISGGELQRALLARALLRKPDLLVLDEPAQGVDINGQQQLYQLIADIRNDYGCGVLMISHDLHLVMEATDHVLCLNTHICCTGHPEAVSQHPEYLKLFGGSLEGIAVYTHKHDHAHDLHGDIVETDRDGEHRHG